MLVVSHLRRLNAEITEKGASTKCLLNGLNTYVNVTFQFFLFKKKHARGLCKIDEVKHLLKQF